MLVTREKRPRKFLHPKTLLILLLISALVCYVIISVIPRRNMSTDTHVEVSIPIVSEVEVFRHHIAAQLVDIIEDMSNPEENPPLWLRLKMIAGQLDSRIAISDLDLKQQETENRNQTENSERKEVCDEEYMGSTFSEKNMFEEGFVTKACDTAKPISTLVTILINMVGIQQDALPKLINILKDVERFDKELSVFVATTEAAAFEIAQNYKKVKVHLITRNSVSVGKVWNDLSKEVKTQYSLLARDISHFNSDARLERQIRAISSVKSVSVAGGAFRNITGHWKVGCHQTNIKSYFLKFLEGYHYSTEDCMFCDYLEGPFLTKASLLCELPFSEELPEEVVFEDWFLQLKQARILVLNCPDVMYFTQGISQVSKTNRDSWMLLARQWEICKVFLPPDTLHLFSCEEIGLSCYTHDWVKSFLYPPCCQNQMAELIELMETLVKDRNITYELESGTMLGALKVQGHIPWDIDGDITYLDKDYGVFYRESGRFSCKGMSLQFWRAPKKNQNSYFILWTPNIRVEMLGFERVSSIHLPKDLQNVPTRVNMVGVWARGQSNPGLYARNRYGQNYLRHAQSWVYMGMLDSWGVYNTGNWQLCSKPYHHACLDHYSSDGNIEFLSEIQRY